MKIYPVIHYLDRKTTFEEVNRAKASFSDGCMLIAHNGNDNELIDVAADIKAKYKDFKIGINLLSYSPDDALQVALDSNLNMLWADSMGVSSLGLDPMGEKLAEIIAEGCSVQLFASVAFKYQAYEPDPATAAKVAFENGFVPTTSGSGTGFAPELAKIRSMSAVTGAQLAIASGMTPENVSDYAPYLGHILVATGVAKDDYRIDSKKLSALILNARAAKMHAYTNPTNAQTTNQIIQETS